MGPLYNREKCGFNAVAPSQSAFGVQQNSAAKRSLYIQLHSVLLAWNLDEAARIPAHLWPTPGFWRGVMVRTNVAIAVVIAVAEAGYAAKICHAPTYIRLLTGAYDT